MKNTLETRLGIFFALGIIAALIVLEMVGNLDFFKKGYHINARFRDVQELKVGDPVKMAGVEVGRVDAVAIDNDKVKVGFKLKEGTVVKTDSKAMIKFTGLMGQNYVAIDFGTANSPQAGPDAVLETAEQADLSALMNKLDNVASGIENITKSFSGDKIDNLLGPITDFVRQNSPNLTAAIANLKTTSDRIATGDGTVGKLINDPQLYNAALSAVTKLESTANDIQVTIADARGALAEAKKVVQGVNEGQGSLGKMVKDERLYNETTEAMTNLKEIMVKINRGDGSIGKLINDESLLKNVKMSLQKLDKATEGLEDAGPLSVMGTAVNSLF